MRRFSVFLLANFLLLVLICTGCTPAPDFWKGAKPGQKKILVTFPPLYCMTQAVAGDNAHVLCMLTSTGPHDYTDSSVDKTKLDDADLFISNGLTLDDSFVLSMTRNHKKQGFQTLNIGEVIEKKHHDMLLKGQEHVLPDGSKHSHGPLDPHIWLGPDLAKLMTEIITAKLVEIDPAGKKGYEERADKFIKELKKLDEHGKNAFKDKKYKKIVTMHESLGYFARAFGLEIVGSIQARPGLDPDPVTLAKLSDLSVKEHVKVLAVEPQYSKGQAETLQKNLENKKIDVAIVVLDPLETAPVATGGWMNPDPDFYLAKMRENIDTLAEVLR